MPTTLMEPAPAPPASGATPPPASGSAIPSRPKRSDADISVAEIISRARARVVAPVSKTPWLLSTVSAVALWASFTPLDFGPLAWVALVPVLLLVRMPQATRKMYLALAVGGWLFSLMTLQWMRLGDPAMYFAWAALAFYVGLYFPVFVGLARIAVHRLHVPLLVSAPLVWVGLEYARAYIMTGFAWYYLGHTQHHWINLLQVSDLVGAYGVSFLVMMGNACVAELIPASAFEKLKLVPQSTAEETARLDRPFGAHAIAVGATVLSLVAVLAYGSVRRSQADFQPGPRIGLVQGNFPSSLKHEENQLGRIWQTHRSLTGLATRQQAELIVWPETMFRWPYPALDPTLSEEQIKALHQDLSLEFWKDTQAEKSLRDMSEASRAALVIGADVFAGDQEGMRVYNSALFFEPGQGLAGRYDKLHRVPFGEYVPMRELFPFLATLTPAAGGMGLSAGEHVHVFQHKDHRLVPLICFEDTVPQLVRAAVKATRDENGKEIDCLVNLTNDGWFHGSSELDQHLITASFRCIETRVPMVRAVNTGISAFIDGDGVIREPNLFLDFDAMMKQPVDNGRADPTRPVATPVDARTSMRDPKTGRYHKELNAVLVSEVPLDGRTSLYVRWGDWFAGLCLLFTFGMLVVGLAGIGKPRTPVLDLAA
ncbi:apolipoprotein N-acyltransferase [Planctomyces sp. SH-PL14]|uniref:apolipoprotein N-acyltransferase n=1 Tax=Planctomyces sp. SH-PL14 TaxID=1632864 RepID=UPI00078C79BA|nr:apolipoprotein N-acyltransferase [Planctomyces sp. SH-PL14]AMV21174.1 Apolipoprotein N-acyltransferase [Planctomyces sp. SH-PL14]